MTKKRLSLGASIIFVFLIYSSFQQPEERLEEQPYPEEELYQPSWFAFEGEDDYAESMIDASHWLDAPAGKHGWVKMKDDRFEFENGEPIKFWGVNIAMGWAYADHDEAVEWARYLSKYGVNSVRFHKHSWNGLEGQSVSTKINPEKQARHDFFVQELKEKGIYYGWSHIYGHRPKPGDSTRILAYEEVLNAGGGHLKSSTIGLVNFAPDLQDLSIALTVNMLEHKNPHTGLRYADDPGLAFIELQNEDNIFFATTHNSVMASPTYKKMFTRQFSDWLREKYQSHQGLMAAWGQEAINAYPDYQQGEHLDKNNIYPIAHHGYLNAASFQRNPHLQRRLLDTSLFLYETQNKFYTRYVAAIRATGYQGTILASCWQAGDHLAHYYNLHSDYQQGFIDRHNYFGGGAGGHKLREGQVKGGGPSMSADPGSGLLATGLQQVKDRPFALSEWMSNAPNPWIMEAAPLLAVYGMGLQGWDASYSYGSNQPRLTHTVEAPRHGVYNSDAPFHMGLYPALSRMLYRGDVQEAEIVSTRKIHVPSLEEGKIGFQEGIDQDHDIKVFSGTVPKEILAIGRAVIEFSDQFEATPEQDFSAFWDKENKSIHSITGELNWYYGKQDELKGANTEANSGENTDEQFVEQNIKQNVEHGYYTVNTAGTKAVAGFLPNKSIELGAMKLQVKNPFAIVFVTALNQDESLETAREILITTIARAKNTGMEYNAAGDTLVAVGTAPLLMEAVDWSLEMPDLGDYEFMPLDHQGRAGTQKRIPVEGNTVSVKGGDYNTFYYYLKRK